MDSGLHWGHGGRFAMEEEPSGQVQLQANGESVLGLALAHLFAAGHHVTQAKAQTVCMKHGLSVMSPDIQIWLRGNKAACWRSTCVFWLHAVEKISELPRSRSRYHLCCFLEEMPVAEWQLFPEGTEGEAKIQLQETGKYKIKLKV